MTPRIVLIGAILALATAHGKDAPPQRTSGNYRVTLRLPEEGVYAREETQIEFRIEDTSRTDPLTGFVAVIRAAVDVNITMPTMAGMPPFQEIAHAEDVPGDYGVHPTFAHGGDYVMHMSIAPLQAARFEVEFPISVRDGEGGGLRNRPPARYTLQLTAAPKTPKPGEQVTLRLMVRDREKPKDAVREFDRFHEQWMHLVIVRSDLSFFAHEHPELGADGVFQLPWRFEKPGEYRLFADIAPRGAGAQVLAAKLNVAGKAANTPIERKPASQQISGVRVDMDRTKLPASRTVPLCFTVTPGEGLEPYLGAPAHLIAIHEDAQTFVHAHPSLESRSATFEFQARFPKPGLYRVWLQFRRNNEVVTSDFTVEAEAN